MNVDPKRPHIAYAVTSDCGQRRTPHGHSAQNEVPGAAIARPRRLRGRRLLLVHELPGRDARRAEARPPAGPRSTATAIRPSRWRSATRQRRTRLRLPRARDLPRRPAHLRRRQRADRLDMSGRSTTGHAERLLRRQAARDAAAVQRARDSSERRRRSRPARWSSTASTGPGDGGRRPRVSELAGERVHRRCEGVEYLGSGQPPGPRPAGRARVRRFDSTEDIDFNHEAELTGSGQLRARHRRARRRRLPPGATCARRATTCAATAASTPTRRTPAPTLAATPTERRRTPTRRRPDGEKAIYRAPVRTEPQATFCTSHVFQQIPGQNRIFMGWYSQGTQVVDYVEEDDGRIQFAEAGYFIPENANTWVSHVFKTERTTTAPSPTTARPATSTSASRAATRSTSTR